MKSLKARVKDYSHALGRQLLPQGYLPPISLFWWYKPGQPPNFGDHLAHVVATKVAAERNLFLDEAQLPIAQLLVIGSILHFANDGDVIWGAGVNGKIPPEMHSFKRLDVRAVRGPLSAAFLREKGIEVPNVFGDPALLLPQLIGGRFAIRGGNGVAIVPNLNELPLFKGDSRVISPLLPWADVITRICASDFVISSSLHGLIVAEAFGIPCRWLRNSSHEARFKFDDYALGTGRSTLTPARSIEEALTLGAMEPLNYDSQPLLDAFPADLWET